MKPLAELEPLNDEERYDYYASIGEALEDGMSEEEAARLIFGPDIEVPEGSYEVLLRRW